MDLRAQYPFRYDVLLILLVRVLAIVFGVGMLRGSNWARWGAIIWLAFHVLISIHPWSRLLVHSLLLVVFAYFLLTSPAREYFRASGP